MMCKKQNLTTKYRHQKNSLGMSNENTYNKAAHVVIVVIAENGNCNEPKGIFIPADDSFEVISSF